MALIQTPSQTVGPFFAIGLPWDDGPDVVPNNTPGAFWIRGAVFDGVGEPVPDALIETWQADPQGRFDHPDDPRGAVSSGFRGFGRSAADVEGLWGIRTVKPGRVPFNDGRLQAPHLVVTILSRGLLDRVTTRIYFGDEEAANAEDPILQTVPEARRHTIIATPTAEGYHLDLRLQGEGETVFFAV
jgi:protocatechuate 3,4-dioxygenase, alpha subunit